MQKWVQKQPKTNPAPPGFYIIISLSQKMAITKKSSGRKKKAATTATLTKKFGGKNYSKSSCHDTQSAAKKAAVSARANGKNARVVKADGKTCVYTRAAGR
jgi:hypothetical protein